MQIHVRVTLIAESHTADHISEAYEDILSDYGVSVSYAITDNASNMVKAFKINLQEPEDADDDWIDEADEEIATDIQVSGARLSCFAHTLQLVIHDGLKKPGVSVPKSRSVCLRC